MNTTHLIRVLKILMTAFAGFYLLVVAIGNLTDYGTNFLFVKHVLSMDTTFPGNALMYRAITTPALHHAAYISIITTEWLVALACLWGAWQMARRRNGNCAEFHESKKWGLAGLIGGLCLFFFGFQVIGGEWFAMWQSDTWNGLNAAFRLSTYLGITLIALIIRED